MMFKLSVFSAAVMQASALKVAGDKKGGNKTAVAAAVGSMLVNGAAAFGDTPTALYNVLEREWPDSCTIWEHHFDSPDFYTYFPWAEWPSICRTQSETCEPATCPDFVSLGTASDCLLTDPGSNFGFCDAYISEYEFIAGTNFYDSNGGNIVWPGMVTYGMFDCYRDLAATTADPTGEECIPAGAGDFGSPGVEQGKGNVILSMLLVYDCDNTDRSARSVLSHSFCPVSRCGECEPWGGP